ncbi:MAG: autotransporter-associated beta strand repeat-containing protein [Kiritimatiellae bacterium]|jgi:autotransporter-associated beta strand protein|nr:autotransporter-associated beta strand repeat-containing protein [Kiritimatiellia bacterium]
MKLPEKSDFQFLMGQVVEECATPEEVAALNCLLEENPDLCDTALDHLWMQSMLEMREKKALVQSNVKSQGLRKYHNFLRKAVAAAAVLVLSGFLFAVVKNVYEQQSEAVTVNEVAEVVETAAVIATSAQVQVWTNTVSGSWTDSANWENGLIANAMGDIADFSQVALAESVTNTIIGTVTTGTMLFGNNEGVGTGWIVAGGTLELSTGDSSVPIISVDGTRALIESSVTGEQGFSKSGPGTLDLVVDNLSYTGTTHVASGTLRLRRGDTSSVEEFMVGDSITVNSGATLALEHRNILDNSVPIKLAGGTFDLGTNTEYISTLTLSSNALIQADSADKYILVYDATDPHIYAVGGGNAGDIACALAIGTQNGPYAAQTRIQEFDVASGTSLTVSGSILDAHSAELTFRHGGIFKTGAGDLILANALNTFQGGAFIEEGLLVLANNTALPQSLVTLLDSDNAGLSLLSDAHIGGLSSGTNSRPVALDGKVLTVGGATGNALYAGSLTGGGTVIKRGANYQTLRGVQSIDELRVEEGTIELNNVRVLDDPSVVVCYTFDDESNLGGDSSANSVTLTNSDGDVIYSAAGRFGGAASFSQGPYFVPEGSIPSVLPAGNHANTVCMWINPDEDGAVDGTERLGLFAWGRYSSGQCIGARTGDAAGTDLTGCSLVYYTWGNDMTAMGTEDLRIGTSPDGWYHIAMVYDPALSSGNRKVYIDGELVQQDDYASYDLVNDASDSVFVIGQTTGRPFKGLLDEVFIADRAFSAVEIQQLMNGVAEPPSSVKAVLPAAVQVTVGLDANLKVSERVQSFAGLSGKGVVDVSSGMLIVSNQTGDATLGFITGDGIFVKEGDHKLTLGSVDSMAGTLVINSGNVDLAGDGYASVFSNVVAYYTFDDPQQPLLDSSLYANHLAVVAGGTAPVVVTNALSGAGLAFDGSSGVTTLSGVFPDQVPVGNSAFTVSFWVNPDSDASWRTGVYSWGVRKGLQINGMRFGPNAVSDPSSAESMTHYFWGSDLSVAHSEDMRTGESPAGWHHVVVTYDPAGTDGQCRKIYIDDVLAGADNPATLNVQAMDFNIGRSATSGTSFDAFKGALDEFMILNKAVSAEEASALGRGLASLAESKYCSVFVESGAALSVSYGTHILGVLDGAGEVSVAENAILNVIGMEKSIIGGVLHGSGHLIRSGNGTLELNGAGDFTGSLTAVSNGTVEISNSSGLAAASDSEIVVEDTGTLQGDGAVASTVTLEAGASLKSIGLCHNGVTTGDMTLEESSVVSCLVSGDNSHFFTVNGVLNIAQSLTLNVTLFDESVRNRRWPLFEAESINGDISGWLLNIENIPSGCAAKVRKDANIIYLTVMAPGTLIILR